MGMGPFEQFQQLAECVTGGVINDCGHWAIEEQPTKVVAYADDFVILSRGYAEEAMKWTGEVMTRLGLALDEGDRNRRKAA
jgi:hypothetical protein